MHKKGLPHPTVPTQERLPLEDIALEIIDFVGITEQILASDGLTLQDSWELSQALEYGKVLFVPNVGPVWK